MSRRLLFVHAHPDDEASKGAATAARYVDEGAEVTLVTCTGGEAGDVLNPAAEVGDEDMASIRARELAAAVAAIGFTRTHRLGYRDSGWHEDPGDVPEGVFSRLPIDEPARRLAGILRTERPHVVVTYPEDGGYPHPDHIMTHLVTERAMTLAADAHADLGDAAGAGAGAWQVAKVYASTIFPAERLEALHAAMLDEHGESPYTKWLEKRAERRFGPDPDSRIACAGHFERRDAALLAHVTQVDPEGMWFAVPRELERRVYPYEGFLLLRSAVLTRLPEADLFAGLDPEAWDAANLAPATCGSVGAER